MSTVFFWILCGLNISIGHVTPKSTDGNPLYLEVEKIIQYLAVNEKVRVMNWNIAS